MTKEDQTGLTIRDSTYQYAKDRKESFNEEQHFRKKQITWAEVIEAGIRDIEDKGVVNNPVTTHDDKTRHPSIRKEVHQDVNERKKAFPLEITWDDIIIHGVDRVIDERMSNADDEAGQSEQERSENTDRLSEDDIRAIVDERINERFDDLEALGRATGQFTSPPQKSYEQEEGKTTVLTTERPYTSARRRYRPDQQEFRQALLEAYGSQCAVCNWECRSLETENPLVEAPHIRPVEEGGASNVSNGILLCPNCHQLFDNGVFSLTDDYRMIINPDADAITKAEVKSYEGRQIHLPSDVSDRPAEEQLQWHRENHNIEPPDEFQN